MKKIIKIIAGVLLVLAMFTGINALSYSEDDKGNSFYELDDELKATSITFKDLLTLQPSSEPANPEIGMIYFDASSRRLKLYDGTGWYTIALEKVSTISKQQVKEIVEKKSEIKTCSESTECGEWGDCINNYQSMTCITVDENCNKYTDIETRDCVSDFKLESVAKDSHDVEKNEEVESEETAEEVDGETEEITETQEDVKTTEVVEDEIETIEESAEETAEEVSEETEELIPEELFDITFDLEESSLSKSDKLVVWMTLQNFGKRYVPVRLVYSVTDETGKEVYRKFEEIRVYTDESIIKQFDDLTLDEGKYSFSLRVEYAGIIEEFSDDFSVETGVFGSIKRFFGRLF